MTRFLALALCLAGCGATLPETVLPRAGAALEGLKSFYEAVCVPPAIQHEAVCEDARKSLNDVGAAYNELNEVLGAEE